MEVVARDGVESDFEQAREAVARHLQVAVDDNAVERITVGMGQVVRRQNERRAAEEARLPVSSEMGTTVIIEMGITGRGVESCGVSPLCVAVRISAAPEAGAERAA